jgi:hypothetical protein
MPNFRTMAIKALSSLSLSIILDASQAIQICRAYSLGPEWVWWAWHKLCTCDKCPKLGILCLVRLIRHQSLDHHQPTRLWKKRNHALRKLRATVVRAPHISRRGKVVIMTTTITSRHFECISLTLII